MAQFRATVKGQGGPTSRLGSKTSGIAAHVNGWHSGVTVRGFSGGPVGVAETDMFDVYMTGGSGPTGSALYVGRVKTVDGRAEWEPRS